MMSIIFLDDLVAKVFPGSFYLGLYLYPNTFDPCVAV
jgi:hypothetical protein